MKTSLRFLAGGISGLLLAGLAVAPAAAAAAPAADRTSAAEARRVDRVPTPDARLVLLLRLRRMHHCGPAAGLRPAERAHHRDRPAAGEGPRPAEQDRQPVPQPGRAGRFGHVDRALRAVLPRLGGGRQVRPGRLRPARHRLQRQRASASATPGSRPRSWPG